MSWAALPCAPQPGEAEPGLCLVGAHPSGIKVLCGVILIVIVMKDFFPPRSVRRASVAGMPCSLLSMILNDCTIHSP